MGNFSNVWKLATKDIHISQSMNPSSILFHTVAKELPWRAIEEGVEPKTVPWCFLLELGVPGLLPLRLPILIMSKSH